MPDGAFVFFHPSLRQRHPEPLDWCQHDPRTIHHGEGGLPLLIVFQEGDYEVKGQYGITTVHIPSDIRLDSLIPALTPLIIHRKESKNETT